MPEYVFIGDDQEWADAHIGFLILVRCYQRIHVQPWANDTNSDGCCDAYGLNIHAPDRSFHLLEKTSFKIETKNIGGWKGYIGKNMKTGSVSVREHTAFLNMWLEKFILCGKTAGPTSNNLKVGRNSGHWYFCSPRQTSLGVSLSSAPSSISQT